MSDDDAQRFHVPYALRAAAAWSWRLILVGVVLYFVTRGVAMFQVIIVPILVALLFVALVRPVHQAMISVPGRGRRLPSGLAALLTILFSLAVVAGLISLIGQQVATGFPSLRDDAVRGLDELRGWLDRGPLNISNEQLNEWVDQASTSLEENRDALVSGALEITSTAGHVITGFFLVLFASYFFLSGGGRIWAWMVGLFPRVSRERVDAAGALAWATLTSFVRATLLVALVDGIGVGVIAAVIGVPLALPLGVLVFLGAFVPIVGALVSGSVAVLVALVAQGPVEALIMLGGVIAVQQLESHLLQPFLLGRAVQVHPLAVILAIAAGVLVAGIVGALFAVPLVAVVNVVVSYLAGTDADAEHPPEPPPQAEDVGPLADEPETRAQQVEEAQAESAQQ